MKKTITREVEIEVCDKCKDELFEYDDRGNPPRYTFGVYFGEGDTAYCENKCRPWD